MPQETPATTATVVISRRVRPGREDDFERWLGDILRAVERAPGYLGSTKEPPGDGHPGEWVVVYRFRTSADLDAWLDSPHRRRLVDASTELIEGEPREQRFVSPAADPVTLVSSIRLRPGTEEEHRVLHGRAMAAARASGGLVNTELREPVPGAQTETVTVLTFASHADLERWLDSDERRRILAEVDALAEGSRTINVVGGFAGWFPAAADDAVPRWKQAVAVYVGLVPLAYATSLVLQRLLPGLAPLPALALGAAVNVVILTWLVMPVLTRLLRPWLTR